MKKESSVTKAKILPELAAWLRACRLPERDPDHPYHLRAYQIAAARLEQGEQTAAFLCLREMKIRYEQQLRNPQMSKTERTSVTRKLKKVEYFLKIMESE